MAGCFVADESAVVRLALEVEPHAKLKSSASCLALADWVWSALFRINVVTEDKKVVAGYSG